MRQTKAELFATPAFYVIPLRSRYPRAAAGIFATIPERASYGYAMANAPERVRAKAKFIAPSNQEDGVIQVICERLGLHLLG